MRLSSAAASVAVLMVIEGASWACMGASHVWRVPVGWCGERPVWVEIDMVRRDVGAKGARRALDTVWRGAAVLKIADGTQQRVIQRLWTGEIGVGKLEEHHRRLIRVGKRHATRLPGFVPAGMPGHRHCDYQRSCGGDLRLEADGESGTLWLVVGTGASPQRYPIELPASYLSNLGSNLGEEPTAAEAAESLGMSRVLAYPAPNGTLLAVDLSSGDEENGPDISRALWPPCACRDQLACPPVAPTLHHGDHLETLVPVSATVLLDGPRAAAPAADLSDDELRRAEQDPPLAPPVNGLYATEPACERGDWSREYISTLAGGRFAFVQANITPHEAGMWISPQGSYDKGDRFTVTGRRLRGSYGSHWLGTVEVDGVLAPDNLRARVRVGAKAPWKTMSFRFAGVLPQ